MKKVRLKDTKKNSYIAAKIYIIRITIKIHSE